MYCVKCGRRAREGEKRCPACGMRLVTPAKLNRLLDEQRERTYRPGRENTDYAAQARKLYAQLSEKLNAYIAELKKRSTPYARKLRREFVKLKKSISERTGNLGTGFEKMKDAGGPTFRKFRRRLKRLRRKLRRLFEQALPSAGHEREAEPERGAVSTKRSSRKKQESFTERNLRTIVAMSLLGLTLLIVLMWGTISEPGQRTFASLGMGSANGYILLGDEYMEGSNYLRAVESYYKSLNQSPSFEAAFKLARAYSYTGDMDKCISALLYCTDNYPGRREPYVQLIAIYPDAASRPAKVQEAIERGNTQFNLE